MAKIVGIDLGTTFLKRLMIDDLRLMNSLILNRYSLIMKGDKS